MSQMRNSHSLSRDRKIAQDVCDEVALCRDIADNHCLAVTVSRGVAHLTGSTETYAQKWAIERATSRVIGVREVRDHLEVRPRSEHFPDDDEIHMAAMAVLRWDVRVPQTVYATVIDGVLRLDGVVRRFADREAAEEAVRNLVGVRDVVNEIKLIPAYSSLDLAAEVEAVVRRRFAFGCRFLTTSVENGTVLLRGLVATFAILDEVERAVRSVPGVRTIENHLLVAPEEEAS